MNILLRSYIRLYYRIANALFSRRQAKLSETFDKKRNLFIYFDYEKEFGGKQYTIKDEGTNRILNLLSREKFKTTWFIVGKVIEKYPESVKRIIADGHEIGSHTYAHISPLHVSKRNMIADFKKFTGAAESIADIYGFHAPQGEWSFQSLKSLKRFGFKYHVVQGNKNEAPYLFKYTVSSCNNIFRLITLGDDWPVYNRELSTEAILEYFMRKLELIQPGNLAGVGFHPWVLNSHPNILSAFESFLKVCKNDTSIQVKPAGEYIKKVT